MGCLSGYRYGWSLFLKSWSKTWEILLFGIMWNILKYPDSEANTPYVFVLLFVLQWLLHLMREVFNLHWEFGWEFLTDFMLGKWLSDFQINPNFFDNDSLRLLNKFKVNVLQLIAVSFEFYLHYGIINPFSNMRWVSKRTECPPKFSVKDYDWRNPRANFRCPLELTVVIFCSFLVK